MATNDTEERDLTTAESIQDSSDSSSSSIAEEEIERKGPPPKPPKPPRRPVNFYIQEKFAETKLQLGRYHRSSDVFRVLSNEWLTLKKRGRQPYEESAERDMLRYKMEKQGYLKEYRQWANQADENVPLRNKKRKVDTPRRPKSAFQFFVDEFWGMFEERTKSDKKLKGVDNLDKTIRVRMKLRWSKMDRLKREPYYKKHMEDVKRYRQEMATVQRLRKLKREQFLREKGYVLPKKGENTVSAKAVAPEGGQPAG